MFNNVIRMNNSCIFSNGHFQKNIIKLFQIDNYFQITSHLVCMHIYLPNGPILMKNIAQSINVIRPMTFFYFVFSLIKPTHTLKRQSQFRKKND